MCMHISMAHAGLPTLVTPLGNYLEMDSNSDACFPVFGEGGVGPTNWKRAATNGLCLKNRQVHNSNLIDWLK